MSDLNQHRMSFSPPCAKLLFVANTAVVTWYCRLWKVRRWKGSSISGRKRSELLQLRGKCSSNGNRRVRLCIERLGSERDNRDREDTNCFTRTTEMISCVCLSGLGVQQTLFLSVFVSHANFLLQQHDDGLAAPSAEIYLSIFRDFLGKVWKMQLRYRTLLVSVRREHRK